MPECYHFLLSCTSRYVSRFHPLEGNCSYYYTTCCLTFSSSIYCLPLIALSPLSPLPSLLSFLPDYLFSLPHPFSFLCISTSLMPLPSFMFPVLLTASSRTTLLSTLDLHRRQPGSQTFPSTIMEIVFMGYLMRKEMLPPELP